MPLRLYICNMYVVILLLPSILILACWRYLLFPVPFFICSFLFFVVSSTHKQSTTHVQTLPPAHHSIASYIECSFGQTLHFKTIEFLLEFIFVVVIWPRICMHIDENALQPLILSCHARRAAKNDTEIDRKAGKAERFIFLL